MLYRRAVLAALLASASGCSGSAPSQPSGPGGDDGPVTPVATTVVLSSSGVTLEALGATTTLSATVRDQNGAAMSAAPVTWSSSDAQVATVSSGGTVTAVANGTATVTASSGAAGATASVTVAQKATSVLVTPDTVRFNAPGESAQLAGSARDAGGAEVAGVTLQWATSNAQVASVSSGGLVTSVGEGAATITAAAGNVMGGATAEVKLQVATHEANKTSIPMGGNTWVVGGSGEQVTSSGVEGWSTPGSTVRTYFRVEQAGSLIVSVTVAGPGADSRLDLTVGSATRSLLVSGSVAREYFAGSFAVDAPGYVAVDLKGVSTQGGSFGLPSAVHVSGSAVSPGMSYIHDNEGSMFYFGRRGPSTHLWWGTPGGMNVRWLYSELTVPVGQDVEGSYFMANGFDGGYFGMQVNGPDRRQFLFSVWSPFQTDDPNSIPDSLKIKLNRKGDGVVIGEFGNEGSGGQSRLEHMWVAGTTYRFLTEITPNGDGTTNYTSWVNIPEAGGWRLIASFKRPATDAWAGSPYSFLENFMPDQGNVTRSGHYGNQWVADESGAWSQVLTFTFGVDNTGGQGFRKDFAGGITSGVPFMKMGGFFDDWLAPGTLLTRAASAGPPDVDLTGLP